MKHTKANIKHTSGFTLIELMLAMLIGLVIMGGVMKLYITTRDTQRSSEDQLQLISDARFAIGTIAFDLRHAGLWGSMNMTELVYCGREVANVTLGCPAGEALPSGIANDCENNPNGDWYIDIARPVYAENDASVFSGTCALEGYKLGTDVLGVHYADTIAIATPMLAAGVVYVRSGPRGGQLFEGNTLPNMVWSGNETARNFPLRSRVYYVSEYTDVVGDGLPSLHRVELSAGPVMADSVLIPGVEDIQFEFGLDTIDSTVNPPVAGKKDGQVNTYVDADSVTQNDWQDGKVIAVKIWLLMRAEREDRDAVGGDQTFVIANKPVTYTDGVRRFLMTSVVRMRNTSKRDKLKVGGQ